MASHIIQNMIVVALLHLHPRLPVAKRLKVRPPGHLGIACRQISPSEACRARTPKYSVYYHDAECCNPSRGTWTNRSCGRAPIFLAVVLSTAASAEFAGRLPGFTLVWHLICEAGRMDVVLDSAGQPPLLSTYPGVSVPSAEDSPQGGKALACIPHLGCALVSPS